MSYNTDEAGTKTAALALADGSIFGGRQIGAVGTVVGEICFNTSITGYQEIITDLSYAGQIITFTFPHIGNVGTNHSDIESKKPAARGVVIATDTTRPANWRSDDDFSDWLISKGLVGITGIDTRRLTRHIRHYGAQNATICSRQNLQNTAELKKLVKDAKEWPGLVGMDLASKVTCDHSYEWDESAWTFDEDKNEDKNSSQQIREKFRVVAVDYGAKLNILRLLVSQGCHLTVVPATTSAEEILSYKPDGIFLSNGPGDPAATAEYAVPTIRKLLDHNLPIFGICLGHQLLALTLGARTTKMLFGHRGANHPVKNLKTGKVEITSQNHGFEVILDSLPTGIKATHISLFDGTLEGLELEKRPVFSVQYHPEASPGPQDSEYLFKHFVTLMQSRKNNA